MSNEENGDDTDDSDPNDEIPDPGIVFVTFLTLPPNKTPGSGDSGKIESDEKIEDKKVDKKDKLKKKCN